MYDSARGRLFQDLWKGDAIWARLSELGLREGRRIDLWRCNTEVDVPVHTGTGRVDSPRSATHNSAITHRGIENGFVVILAIIMMSLLAWRLGAFDELARHRQIQSFDRDLYLDMDEADWEDRQQTFRRTHPPVGRRRPHMSLGSRR